MRPFRRPKYGDASNITKDFRMSQICPGKQSHYLMHLDAGIMPSYIGFESAIGKDFIEAQGGNISVESEYGAGSTFSIQFLAAKM